VGVKSAEEDRVQQGCCTRAYKDVFTACPHQQILQPTLQTYSMG